MLRSWLTENISFLGDYEYLMICSLCSIQENLTSLLSLSQHPRPYVSCKQTMAWLKKEGKDQTVMSCIKFSGSRSKDFLYWLKYVDIPLFKE